MPLVQVEKNTASGRGLKHLVFRAPDSVIADYKTPGQYVILSRDGAQSFFSIASEPGSERLHLLVKDQEGLAEFICNMKPGDKIECSPAQGKGFSLTEGRATHLFSMGSGISPFRALIEHYRAGGYKPASLVLWQGCRDRDYLPFPDDCERWEQDGLEIKYCFDGENDEGPAENVQQRLAREAPDLAGGLSYWIGSDEFGAAIKETTLGLGLGEDDYRTNF